VSSPQISGTSLKILKGRATGLSRIGGAGGGGARQAEGILAPPQKGLREGKGLSAISPLILQKLQGRGLGHRSTGLFGTKRGSWTWVPAGTLPVRGLLERDGPGEKEDMGGGERD